MPSAPEAGDCSRQAAAPSVRYCCRLPRTCQPCTCCYNATCPQAGGSGHRAAAPSERCCCRPASRARANRGRTAVMPPALKLVALAVELLRQVNTAAADCLAPTRRPREHCCNTTTGTRSWWSATVPNVRCCCGLPRLHVPTACTLPGPSNSHAAASQSQATAKPQPCLNHAAGMPKSATCTEAGG